MSFWKHRVKKNKKRQRNEHRVEAYCLTPEGFNRLKRQDNPTISYEGAMILAFLKDGKQTIGDIVDKCRFATGVYVRREIEKLVSLGLVARDDVVIYTEVVR